MVEGVQQGPVLVETFFMVAEEYVPPTAAPGTWALMSPAQGRPGWTIGVTGNGGRGTAGAGPGRDLLYNILI